MVRLLLALDHTPAPHDAADALAIAICHLHQFGATSLRPVMRDTERRRPRSWRQMREADLGL
jgi:hypothetical protein